MWLGSPVSVWLCLTAHLNAQGLLVDILPGKSIMVFLYQPPLIEFGFLLLKKKRKVNPLLVSVCVSEMH